MRLRQGGAATTRRPSHLLRGLLLLALLLGVAPAATTTSALAALEADRCAGPVSSSASGTAAAPPCGTTELDATSGAPARLSPSERREGSRLLPGAAGCCADAVPPSTAPLTSALRARPPTPSAGIHSPGGVARRGPPATTGT